MEKMNLYQIEAAIENFDFEADPDTGEVLNMEEWEALQMNRRDKIEATALVCKRLAALESDIKAEVQTLNERAKAVHRRSENCKRYLDFALHGENFETGRCKVSYKKNPPSLTIVDDDAFQRWLAQNEAEFVREKIVREPDKTAIKKAIQGGAKVAGAQVTQSVSMTVK